MSNNESVFFGFKIGKTKHKLIKARDFLRFFVRNCGLHLEHILKNKKQIQGITL